MLAVERSMGQIRRAATGTLAMMCCLWLAAAAQALPPPPPSAQEQAQIDAFFAALPRRLPAEALGSFEPLVHPEVKVWRDGRKVHDNRAEWFAELASNPFAGWRSANPPVAAGIGRDDFFRQQDGGIVVRELTIGIPPEGEHVMYHSGFNLRFVTYTLKNGVLVKVDYGEGMDRLMPPAAYRQRR